jgi:eukaryotic-like serine/threonine-protein kinase
MLRPGTRISVYEITGLLGAGGMGEVYRARDTRLGRDVAVKVLPSVLASDHEYITRLHREAHSLASLNHPNIASIYGLEDRALIMELVEGITLAGWIGEGAQDLDAVLPIALQICDALEAAHERGITHRDLKPSNVKITAEGRVKLLDFGLAKSNETAAQTEAAPNSPTLTFAATMPGVILGTAAYMSPEQARGRRADHRADIWSFGVVLYEMVTARLPFGGSTVSDVIAAILTRDIDMTSVPESIRPIVGRCMERDLRKRYGWIGEVRLALEASRQSDVSSVSVPHLRRWFLGAGLVTAGAAAGAAIVRYAIPQLTPDTRVARRLTRLTRDGGSVAPSVSADGKFVCYLSRRGERGQWDLWMQQVSGGGAIRIVEATPTSFVAGRPVFSADGGRIYYRSDNPPAGVYEVPSLGGDARLMIAGALAIWPSPDGKWIAWSDGSRLFLRSADGSEDRDLSPGERIEPGMVVWAPDSQRLLVSVIRTKQPVPGARVPREMMIVSLNGSPQRISGPGLVNLEQRGFGDLNLITLIAWLPGDDIVVPLRFGDAVNLFKLPLRRLDDSVPQQVTFGAWNNRDASVAGQHLVFATQHEVAQIWGLPADLNAGKVFGSPRLVTPERVEMQFQTVSPDNSMLAYIARRTAGQGLYVLDLGTGKERNLIPDKALPSYPVWSPDGKKIAYSQYPDGISVVPSGGGSPTRIARTFARLRSWTPDGRFLLLWTGNPPPLSVGVLDLKTGTIKIVYGNGRTDFVEPRLSPDGKRVAFVSRTTEAQRLYVAPFRGDQQIPEDEWVEVADNARYPFWSPDSRVLFFVRGTDARVSPSIQRQQIDDGGRLVGPAGELCRLEGFVLANAVLNTISVGNKEVFFLFNSQESEVWMTSV